MKNFFLLAALLFIFASTVDAARIESVSAVVTAERSLPPMVKERMEDSVRAIGEQLLAGRSLPISEQWRAQQADIIIVRD